MFGLRILLVMSAFSIDDLLRVEGFCLGDLVSRVVAKVGILVVISV